MCVSEGLLELLVISEPELGQSEAEDSVSNPKFLKSVLPQDSSGRRTQACGGVDKCDKEESHDGSTRNSHTGAVSECTLDYVKAKKKKARKFLFFS